MLASTVLALSLLAQEPVVARALPPLESPEVVRTVEVAFPTQGNVSLIEPATYLYYIHTRPSRPSQNEWVLYDERLPLADFRRLWATGFLDNLSIEVRDEPYENGVMGKRIVFNLEERQRAKIVDFTGSKAVEVSTIEEKLKELGAELRLDSFIDAGTVRKAEGAIRQLLEAKGFQSARVTHTIAEMPGSPKIVHVTFHLDEGPKVRIAALSFTGNRTVDSRRLRAEIKNNRARAWWVPSLLPAWLLGGGVYQEAKLDEDADQVVQHYRDRGYVTASVGRPEVATVRESADGKTRWVALRIPVVEGERYRLGSFAIEGNAAVGADLLRPLFKLASNDYYSEKSVRDGLEKAREVYGAAGYFEFTGYPELKPNGTLVDVTLRIAEGRQFFVNRITLSGNLTTHDDVVRRELALVEGGLFNTEALKYSVRRLNQLGYFKPIEDQKSIAVEKAADSDNKVDITLKVDEQNRNAVNFGAGLSQYEGLFGNLSYTTANLLGRGESLTIALQRGSRSSIYQVGVTEPYLFGRPISGSIELYSRKNDYYTTSASATTLSGSSSLATSVAYSEVREGSTWAVGRPLWRFTRAQLNYTYEVIDVLIADDLQSSSGTSSAGGIPLFNPYLDNGRHIDSRVMPAVVYNSVDSPLTAHSGTRITASAQIAGAALRGGYSYLKPELELIRYFPTSRRTGFGLRGQAGWLGTFGDTTSVPYYLRYYLGGENQIRGTDIRSVGPFDSSNRALGGSKFLLFNAEYYLDLFGPVRLLAFHDAGQSFDEAHPFSLRDLRTSSGGELRVFLPVVNVPIRLIYYVNVYRDTFQPARGFKFAVGTTF